MQNERKKERERMEGERERKEGNLLGDKRGLCDLEVARLLHDQVIDNPETLRYLNRASDLTFALARFADEPNPQMFEGREGSS